MRKQTTIRILISLIVILLFIAVIQAWPKPIVPAPTPPSPKTTPTYTPFTPPQMTPTTRLPVQQTPSATEQAAPSPTGEASEGITGNAFYVAPSGPQGEGSPEGDGSREHPWDLETALKRPKAVKPGDTIWLRGGMYNYRNLDYLYSRLKGEPGKPVTIRALPGERVTIDAALVIRGEWTTFWGLEIIDSTPDRTENYYRKDGIAAWKPGIKLINNIIHDAGGFGFWWQAEDAEMYGNLIYNNGYIGEKRGHGHGIYTTNKTGVKRILDNVLFNNFSGINVHAYSEKTYLDGFLFEGNVSFNGSFLVGGLVPASNVSLVDNFFYRGPVQLGYRDIASNKGLVLSGNYLHSSDGESLNIRRWEDVQLTGNIDWMGSTQGVSLSIMGGETAVKRQTAAGEQVFVRPNQYEPGRGHIVIYNWEQKDSVSVDISSLGLKNGDRYILHNAQNYFDETIEGVYTGTPIEVPMTGWTVAIPTGLAEPVKPATFPEFGVFIIERAAGLEQK